MKLHSVTLYQPDYVLEARLSSGAYGLIGFIRALVAQLAQPEFENPPADDRAVVIAIHEDGRMRGWAVSKSGALLESEQEHLNAALNSTQPPEVAGGLVLVAVHYSSGESSEARGPGAWIPCPKPWSAMGVGREEVEALVTRFFEACVRRM